MTKPIVGWFKITAVFLDRAGKPGDRTVVPRTEISDAGLTFAFCADPGGHVAGLSAGAVQ